MKYQVATTNDFRNTFKKLTKGNHRLGEQIMTALEQMEEDPFYKGLKTHKVQSRKYGIAYSSRVTGDIRVIWDFRKDSPIILALTVGGHSGKHSVY